MHMNGLGAARGTAVPWPGQQRLDRAPDVGPPSELLEHAHQLPLAVRVDLCVCAREKAGVDSGAKTGGNADMGAEAGGNGRGTGRERALRRAWRRARRRAWRRARTWARFRARNAMHDVP